MKIKMVLILQQTGLRNSYQPPKSDQSKVVKRKISCAAVSAFLDVFYEDYFWKTDKKAFSDQSFLLQMDLVQLG